MLSAVLVYGFTRDRVRWGMILRRLGLGTLTVAVCGGAALYLWNEFSNRPQKLAGLWNIPLGSSESDVIFQRGKPAFTCTNPTDPEWKSAWYLGDSVSSETERYRIRISYFGDNGVRRILLFGELSESQLPSAQSIGNYQSSSDVVQHWGKPDSIVESDDKLARWYTFRRYNLGVQFQQDRPTMIEAFDSDFIWKGKSLEIAGEDWDASQTACVDDKGAPTARGW